VLQELVEARKAMAEGRGQEAELQRQMQMELEAEREKRVAHLQQIGVRRLFQQGLARGWTAWLDMFVEYRRKKRLLQNAGARLSRPKMVSAFVHWQRDWDADIAAKRAQLAARAKMTQEELLADEVRKREAVEDKLKKLEGEMKEARKAMAEGRGQEAEMQRQMEEKLTAEKEKRVAHLQQIGVRRLFQQGLARGWTAWHDGHVEYRRKQKLLRHASARLARPKMVTAFSHWQHDWEYAEALRASQAKKQRNAAAAAKRASSEADTQAELTRLRTELAEARKAMAEGRGQEVERQRQLQEQLEAEKEKRVAHLQQIGVRRLFAQGLARGWTAWHDMYREYQRKRNVLRHAGARLSRPKMVAAFSKWQRDWDAEMAANAVMTQEERLASETTKRSSAEAELAKVRKELADTRKAILEGRGLEAERQRLADEKLEAEKEKRVLHLQQLGIRRLTQQGIARGWSAWLEGYLEYRRKANVLRHAGARLARPKFIAAFVHWQRDWEYAEAFREAARVADASRSLEESFADERKLRMALESSLHKVQLELESARKAALDGVGQEVEMQRQMQFKLQQEKEKRVEHLRSTALRRIARTGLSRGWNAWHDYYSMRVRMLRLLRASSSRLSRPQFTAAFVHWQRSWETEQALNATTTAKQRLKAEVAQRTAEVGALQVELQQVKLDLIAARDAMLAGNGKESELKRRAEEQLAAEREKRVLHLQQIGVRRLFQQGLARGWSAWLDMYQERKRMRRVLQLSVARLSKPKLVSAFVHWHRDWEVTEVTKKAQVAARAAMSHEERLADETEKRIAAEEKAFRFELDLIAARDALKAGKGNESDLKRQYDERLEQEREKRVAHLQQVGLRRLFHQELGKGWTTWHTKYLAITRKREMIKEAVRRLTLPKLVAAFRHWQAERANAREISTEAITRKRNEEEQSRRDEHLADLNRLRADADQQIQLQRVALTEARQAATEALQRMSAERTAADDARRQAKEALEGVKQANMSATRAHELLNEQQEKAATQLSKLLAEQRSELTSEIIRLRDEKDAEINRLRQLLEEHQARKGDAAGGASGGAAGGASAADFNRLKEKFAERENEMRLLKLKLEDLNARPAPVDVDSAAAAPRFAIVFDPNKSVVEQLREQIQEKGLRTLDLFRELDEDNDGVISKKDWTKGLKMLGEDVPDDVLDKAFQESDPDKSGTIEFKEFDTFLKGRKSPGKSPVPAKKGLPPGKRPKPSLLAALATSMGVRPQVITDAMDTVGASEDDFEGLMKSRAAAFGAADLDFDGKLDFNEFCTMVKARETAEYTEAQLKAKFSALDIDGSGKIDQYEFITFSLRDALKRSKGRAIDIFRIWDDDSSGYIDKTEFAKAVVALGFCCAKQDIDSVFNHLDDDNSGKIEYKELNNILRQGVGSAVAEKPSAPKAPAGKGPAGKGPSPRTAKLGGTGAARPGSASSRK